MIIKDISIQNFKSYGNNKQTLNFDEKGQLVLLQGLNGSGKSTLQESIDFSLFGVVRGKERKRIPQSELPNRTNDSLLTSIEFINENNDNIKIERGLKPTRLKVQLNSNDITQTYKKYDQTKKENLVGFNYDLYKSFISMSLNDFTNFTNLSPETKRKLLNRLFNLDELDDYYKISKDIIKNNKRNYDRIKIDLNNNKDTIETYKKNIDNIKIDTDDNNSSKNEIKNEILLKKSKFLELKENIYDLNKIHNKLNEELNNRLEVLNAKNHRLNKIDLKIDDYNNKIKIFEKGQCPTCNTVLKSNKYDHNLNMFIDNKNKLLDERNDILNDILNYKKDSKDIYLKKKKIYNELYSIKKEYNDLNIKLSSLKNKYDNFNKNNTAIKEIEKNIDILVEKNKELDKILHDIEEKNEKYKKLNDIFSLNGIRKSIINSVIEPINKYLSEYLKELESSFRVNINNEFDTEIYERYINKIHPESLSSGESRKINIALSLSYLEIITKIRKTNVLFLDEIFANVDSENIDILLKLLKKFAIKYDMNIIVISQDHTPFDMNLFDRIITINKEMSFSNIKDEKLI